MVKELGALDAHKQVLRPGLPHDSFVRLAYIMDPPHPELTAEYAALYNYPDLFTEEELAVARERLEARIMDKDSPHSDRTLLKHGFFGGRRRCAPHPIPNGSAAGVST